MQTNNRNRLWRMKHTHIETATLPGRGTTLYVEKSLILNDVTLKICLYIQISI